MLWYWVFLVAFGAGVFTAHLSGLLRIDGGHPKVAWLIVALVVFNASWMGFDGGRAFVVGDYITPQGAGQLGPWSAVVGALGVDPRSNLMKAIFVVYGLGSLAVVLGFLAKAPWGWWGMVVVASLGLWYLPFGTVLNLLALMLLLLPQMRAFWFGAPNEEHAQ